MSTIDPGMEDTVQSASHGLRNALSDGANDTDTDTDQEAGPQNDYEGGPEEEAEEDDDFRQPSQYWFASTLCPLLAGTFGPIANGFSICALAMSWRVYIPPGGSEQSATKITDPNWLIIVNAISLAFALAGNSSLLLNMARKLRFEIAQPVTILGFFTAGFLLIADLAAISASPTYWLTGKFAPAPRHALSGAPYYAILAASLYMVVGIAMCLTVYGAIKGYYEKAFKLTDPQRTLMLQTMLFVAYLLLGALVFSNVEGWDYLVAVYWADVTLLTVGLGDYSPQTHLGQSLLMPFAIGGILMIGLVIGSIRSLVLERGQQKLAARFTEKRRSHAIHNVDERRQTIRISFFTAYDFSTEPSLSPAQRREEEFETMRKVQDTAARERRWFALALSMSFALILWFVGAVVFMITERKQEWTYFDALYFTYVCLLTIGYGNLAPKSYAGQAFFVIWSLLAVPSLTILISNLGDTIVKWFSDLTIIIGKITVLPDDNGFRYATRAVLQHLVKWMSDSVSRFWLIGIFGSAPSKHQQRKPQLGAEEHERAFLDRLAERLNMHIDDDEFGASDSLTDEEKLKKDVDFYHYVLARECRNLQRDLSASPPTKYTWSQWEYYLKLMGNEQSPEDFPGQRDPEILVPGPLRAPESRSSEPANAADKKDGDRSANNVDDSSNRHRDSDYKSSDSESADPGGVANAQNDGVVGRKTELSEWRQKHEEHKQSDDLNPHQPQRRHRTTLDLMDWSWLSNRSPLMSNNTETEWILERLSAALERELNRQRKGHMRTPPVRLSEVKKRHDQQRRQQKEGVADDAKEKGAQSRHEAGQGMHSEEDKAMTDAAQNF